MLSLSGSDSVSESDRSLLMLSLSGSDSVRETESVLLMLSLSGSDVGGVVDWCRFVFSVVG